jgi:hypothetical protein
LRRPRESARLRVWKTTRVRKTARVRNTGRHQEFRFPQVWKPNRIKMGKTEDKHKPLARGGEKKERHYDSQMHKHKGLHLKKCMVKLREQKEEKVHLH